jgi:RNA polymerase sigma factor (sigma-70 family)
MSERLTELTADHRAHVESVLLQHGRFIEAVATKCAPSYDLVPDIVQEVRVRVCQSLHTFREHANIRTWLFAITRNTAVSIHRREHRVEAGRERLAAHTVDEVIDIEADLIAEDDQRQRLRLMGRAIDQLSPRQREAVRNMLAPHGVSPNRDKTTLFRARSRMRRWINEHRDDDLTETGDE